MKKILFLIDSLVMAGAERLTVNLVNALDKKKYFPVVVCVNGIGGKDNFRNELSVEPIVFNSGIKNSFDVVRKFYKILKIARKINQIIKKEKISLIQSSLEISDIYASLLKLSNPKLKFISVRHNATPIRLNFLRKRMYNFVLKKADKIVCVSDEVALFTKKNYRVPEKKIKIIYNSVNTDEISKAKPFPENKFKKIKISGKTVFLSVGRLVEEKNHSSLINAFSRLNNKDSLLFIVGKGPQEKNLKDIIKSHNLQKRVFIFEPDPEIFRYYKTADIFVLMSKHEGFGIVFLEAMAARLPVITSNIKPMSDFIKHNKTGFLANNEEELIKIMDNLIISKDKRVKVGIKAKESSSNFSIKEMVKKYESLY